MADNIKSVDNNNIKSVDNSGLPEATQKILDLDPNYVSGKSGAGIFGDTMTEACPNYIESPCEWVKQHGNSWIVLGRDRPASRASGYAGQGHTQASAIDIVVGRGDPVPTSDTNVDPDFSNDAARIYISQKADIDDYFNIEPSPWGGKSKLYSKSVSAIGIKADAVRIIGDMGIKLVTRTSATNSKGGPIAINGIELIANNDDTDLQPMIRGDNMVEALAGLEKKISELSSLVLNFLKDQASYNNAIAKHTHVSALAGPTTNSVELVPAGINAAISTAEAMVDNFKGRMNMNINWHSKYLSPSSSKYICSKYNKVN
jgi:hypothetical protein